MATYKKEEMFTATQVVRNFSEILGRISSGELKRAVIVKNNNFDAVLVNVEEYERLYEAVEILEEIYAQNNRTKNGN